MLNPSGESAAQILETGGSPLDVLEARIAERIATIGIVGLGYVGLPLAVEYGRKFSHVIGFDMNPQRIERVNEGKSHIQDVPDSDVAELVRQEVLLATTDFSKLAECDAVIICVPTPLEKNRDPDLSYIRGAAGNIAETLRPGQIVILESTTYPGTTDELLLPLFEQHGLKLDRDFLLAFSPERVDPGSGHNITKIPKVVGGCSERSTETACDLYATVIEKVHPVSSARVAETVKLLENTFRLVNIGLINEFAVLCNHLAIDSNEVIQAAATKPFGYMPFFPGPGVGGHCIPLDPLYLNWKAEQQGFVSRFIELADEVNTKMPAHIVELITDALNDRAKAVRDARILIVGVAYKDNVEDTRQSPAIAIVDRLRARGAYVAYHDPLVPLLDFDLHDWPEWRPRVDLEKERRALRVAHGKAFSRRRRYDMLHSVDLDPLTIEEADCVVVLAKHREIDFDLIARHADIVIDTRDALSKEQRREAKGKIVRL